MPHLSPFQKEFIAKVEAFPGFSRWCVDPRALVPGLPSDSGDLLVQGTQTILRPPLLFTYYTKDGTLHAHRVGKLQLIATFIFPPSPED